MIKVWDYVNRKVVYQETYVGKGTVLEHMPQNDGNKGRVFAAGFDNGVVRVFMVTADGLRMLKSFKAHDDPIVGIKFSQDLKMLVTGSKKGDIFFFDIDGTDNIQKFEPLCTVKLPDDAGINDFKFNDDDKCITFGCNTGFVYEIERPVTS
jgi:WD40 repeat protein